MCCIRYFRSSHSSIRSIGQDRLCWIAQAFGPLRDTKDNNEGMCCTSYLIVTNKKISNTNAYCLNAIENDLKCETRTKIGDDVDLEVIANDPRCRTFT